MTRMVQGEVCQRRYMGPQNYALKCPATGSAYMNVRNIHVGQQTILFLTQSPFDRALSNMNCIMISFMSFVARQILERRAMWHACKELTNACMFLKVNLKKTLLGEATRKWEDDIKTDLKEIEWDGVGWIRLRVEKTDGLLWTPSWTFGFHKFGEFLRQLRTYRLLKMDSAACS